jgi:hypothetical protein
MIILKIGAPILAFGICSFQVRMSLEVRVMVQRFGMEPLIHQGLLKSGLLRSGTQRSWEVVPRTDPELARVMGVLSSMRFQFQIRSSGPAEDRETGLSRF